MNELLIHPAAAFALIGVLMLILVGLYFRHVHLSTRTLVNMSLMLAITVVLHQIKLFHMPQGGSVTAGSMVPLLFIAYRYGAGIGSLAGFLYGLINLLSNPFIVYPCRFCLIIRCLIWLWGSLVSGRNICMQVRLWLLLAGLSVILFLAWYFLLHTRHRE